MGLWINTAQTQNIVAKLDWKFSDARLKKIRDTPARLARFNPQNVRTLRRISYKMRMWPGRNAYSNNAKKWYGFLLRLETNHKLVHDAIRTEIWTALQDPTVVAIKFVAVEGTAVDVDTQILGTGSDRIKLIVLSTQAHDGSLGSEPGRDQDEPPGEPDDGGGEDLPEAPAPSVKKSAGKKSGSKKGGKKNASKKKGDKKKKAKKKSKRR